jgi:hypothetical protein
LQDSETPSGTPPSDGASDDGSSDDEGDGDGLLWAAPGGPVTAGQQAERWRGAR